MLAPKQFHFSFFLFFLVLSVLAQGKGKTMPLKNILIEIEQRYHVNFNYTEENVAGVQLIRPKKSLSFEQILQYLTEKTNLSFENLDNKFINIYKKEKNSKKICGYVFSNTERKPYSASFCRTYCYTAKSDTDRSTQPLLPSPLPNA